jgi:ABC-type polar amino acid transport system ATPase subunit
MAWHSCSGGDLAESGQNASSQTRAMLTCRDIRKRFGSHVVLAGVNLDIAAATSTGLFGPSGSGKTTLLRILCVLDQPDEGEIRLDGEIVTGSKTTAKAGNGLHPQVTMVFQQLFLWPHLTNLENILLGLPRHNFARRAQELTDHLEISDLLPRYPNEVSLGQRQRVAICRALIREPRFALLDEVTSALDRRLSNMVAQLLREQKSRGLSTVVASHDREFLEMVVDRTLRVEQGVLEHV